MSWTDTRVELLTKLWADGLSASQIAAELGGITRNAVIGKAHRLGLAGRVKSPSSSTPRPRKTRTSVLSGKVRSTPFRDNTAFAYDYAVDEPESELVEIPLGQRKTLMQLTEKVCHWPVGDPANAAFFFCGGEVSNGHPSYCAFHSRIACQPPSDRRRDKRPYRSSYAHAH